MGTEKVKRERRKTAKKRTMENEGAIFPGREGEGCSDASRRVDGAARGFGREEKKGKRERDNGNG